MNDNITKLIETLAAKLGTTAEYLWAVLIRQAPISATTSLILCLVFITLAAVYTKWLIKKAKDDELDCLDNESNFVIALVGGLLSIIGVIVIICLFSDIITGYFNPEYWALQKILDQLK